MAARAFLAATRKMASSHRPDWAPNAHFAWYRTGSPVGEVGNNGFFFGLMGGLWKKILATRLLSQHDGPEIANIEGNVADAYVAISRMISNGDMDSLRKVVTPSLFQSFEAKGSVAIPNMVRIVGSEMVDLKVSVYHELKDEASPVRTSFVDVSGLVTVFEVPETVTEGAEMQFFTDSVRDARFSVKSRAIEPIVEIQSEEQVGDQTNFVSVLRRVYLQWDSEGDAKWRISGLIRV